MKKYLTLVLLAQLTINSNSFSQNIAVNSTGNLPDTSAMLDVSSTTKGFLAPRMTTTEQNAIPLPAKGLLIFNTTDNVFKVNTGTTGSPVWTSLATGSAGIGLASLSATAPLNYNNSTGVFSIPQATTSANGFLSSIDWNTFNNKQAALNGTGFVKANGTSITYDNSTYLTAATGTTNARSAISLTTSGSSGAATYNSTTGVLNIPSYAAGSGTVTSVGLTSSDITVGGTSPITTGGTYTLTLPTINSNVGSFTNANITVNAKGQVTSISNGTASTGWLLTGNTGTTQPAVPATYGSSTLGANENYLGTTDSRDLVFATNDLERMRIMKNTGYLGIGTAAPSKPLDLVKNLSGEGLMKIQNTNASGYSSIDIWSNTTQIGNIGFSNAGATYANSFYFATNTTNNMVFATNNSERIRIDGSNGNVGIGQTSPGSALDVKGTLRLSGATSGFVGFAPAATAGSAIYTLPSADGANGQQLTTNGSGTLSWTSASSASGTVTSVAALTLGTSGTDLSSTVATNTTTPVITLNVPTASASNRGALSSADWTTFNNKQAALNGTGFVKASGTTITYDNSTYLTAATGTTNARSAISLTTTGTSGAATYNSTTGILNIPTYAAGSGTVTSVGLTSSDITVGGSSPITTSGTYTLTLPTVNSNVGSFTNANITVNTKGQVTAVSNGTATTVGLLVDADRTTSYTPGSSYSTLAYNSAGTNVGTAYNTTSGVFTAPATGLYQIMISNVYSVANSVNNTLSARIIVNGSTETEVWTSLTPYSGSTIYSNLRGNTIVAMTNGQTASIQIGGLNNTMTPNVGTGQHVLKIVRLN